MAERPRGESVCRSDSSEWGMMGGGLARNLIRAGKEVVVFDLNADAIQKTLAAGSTGKMAKDLHDLDSVDVLFTSLPLPEHVKGIMLGPAGLLSRMKPGSTHIEVSTIDPATARLLSDAAEAKGIHYLQCPLGKTPAQAEKR